MAEYCKIEEIVKTVINDFLKENNNQNANGIIAYHSTDDFIDDFDFDYRGKAGSSTRMDGVFFSDIPQKSWGDNVYKVKIISIYKVTYDLDKSRFDSLSVQEAFDALLRGETAYVKEDLENSNIDYEEYTEDMLWDLTDDWRKNLDLIIVKNTHYVNHKVEYIVPSPKYNGHSAIIMNLGLVNF